MSNVNAGIPESASQGHSSHRNPPFRSQPQLPPTLSHHEHHATDAFVPRHHHSQHSGQFQQTHFNTPSGHHQQRPPVAPTHQPRLHHSISAGNIALVANAGRFGGIGGAAYGSAVAPKKKDPYATAWRTYSKIAEELQLLNPDGSLYPISKEAILKYLHHQSKRIKSSNLHWYVNGLKKHQENLGFPWDDVRYDDQVVGLLKELTLHPVMVENGDEDHHHGHSYGSQPNRQRQTSNSSNSNSNLAWKGGHHYSSSSSAIDTARIANLSISQSPQSAHHQNHYIHSGSYGGGLKQQHHSQYLQQAHQSQRIQQPPPPKPYYHSAPVQLSSHHSRTPSGQEMPNMYQGSQSYHQQHHHQQSTPGGSSSALPPSGEPHPREGALGATSRSILHTKRKRSEFGLPKRRVPSAMSVEGDEHEEEDTREDDKDDDDESDDRRHEMDEFDDQDDEEDSNRYQPLKRRASTGTLLSQVKASVVKHVPGNVVLGRDGPNPQRYDHRYRSPSPDGGRDDRYSSLSRQDAYARDSPPNSASSTEDPSALFPLRPTSALGIGGTNTSSSTVVGSVGSTSTATPAAKMTVQFSEVVECAQQLQFKYGNRCKDHPWGCVEIHDRHLELTIKMYLDWAGLVASGRLTMDDLPDLPEFRKPELQFGFVLGSPANATSGSGPTGSTLKRISSTPFSTQHRMSFNTYRSPSTSPTQYPTEEDDPQSSPPRRATGFSILDSPNALDLGSDIDASTPVTSPSSKPTTLTFASPPHARGARKMPSSPALNLHHALQGHDLRHHTRNHSSDHHLMRSRAHGSIVSTSTASSPPSELESDDEEDDDLERERHKGRGRGGAAMDVDMEGEGQHQARPSTWMSPNGSPPRASGLSTTTATMTGGMAKELTPTERMEDDEDESRNGTDKRINVATQEEDGSTSTMIQVSAEGQVGMIGDIAEAKTLSSTHSSGSGGNSGHDTEFTSPPMSNESVGARKESKLRIMMGRGKALFGGASLKAVSPSTATTTSSTTTSTVTTSSGHKSVGVVATGGDSGAHNDETALGGGGGGDTEDCEMVE
ncbi:hypothetical protein CPC16_008014 [Podila verticillata]|nr:hypothetical protein CPC16_008014 [Podila verticillata]